MKNNQKLSILIIFMIFYFFTVQIHSQEETFTQKKHKVTLEGDSLFYIASGLGILTAEKRADEISTRLNYILNNKNLVIDSIKAEMQDDYWVIKIESHPIMAISNSDAEDYKTTDIELVEKIKHIIKTKFYEINEMYSNKSIIKNSLFTLIYLLILSLFFYISSKLFPFFYKKINSFESIKIKSINLKNKEIVKLSSLVKTLLIIVKGIKFVFSLYVVYLFFTKTIDLWPYTRKWELQPFLKSISLFIFYTVLFFTVGKGVNSLIKILYSKYSQWKGEKIKSLRIKNIELISADRMVEALILATKISRFALFLFVFYTYITFIFSLFKFSEIWADTLLIYILTPLKTVWIAFRNFLPDLFFIIVLIFVFNYLIKFVKFIFQEIDKGNLEIPGFHKDWAMPTFKIVRFMILILAAIVIFPYLPGSNSPFFQGISVFLGILFSLGSSSAISNMVAGVVLTYMRPFKLGDRVKIADTMGDVIEKTLLVTRVRTPKNIDITIPNAMVLGSHIINFSSTANENGLILHTTVTIGYDVPWKKVHELLIAAAIETENVLVEPKPFVFQTSLDDFYVAYELNIYTNKPNNMGSIYSVLHSKIQDKFNEAGVEIMSPHYGAMRDGNQVTIPESYLPKDYKAPSFKVFGLNLFDNQNKKD